MRLRPLLQLYKHNNNYYPKQQQQQPRPPLSVVFVRTISNTTVTTTTTTIRIIETTESTTRSTTTFTHNHNNNNNHHRRSFQESCRRRRIQQPPSSSSSFLFLTRHYSCGYDYDDIERFQRNPVSTTALQGQYRCSSSSTVRRALSQQSSVTTAEDSINNNNNDDDAVMAPDEGHQQVTATTDTGTTANDYVTTTTPTIVAAVAADAGALTTTTATKMKEQPILGMVSKDEIQKEEVKHKRLSEVFISEVLLVKHSHRWVEPVVYQYSTIKDVIVTTIDGGLSGMMVLDNPDERHVVGLLTSRDLLRIMALGIKEEESNDTVMSRIVGDYMTPISQVIYGRPEETVGMVRTIMAKLGIKCLPILSRNGRVEGLITARDMSDFGLTAKDKGGKQSYLNDVSSRVGLSSNTSMADPPQYLRAHLALEQSPLFVNVGLCALPHPFKTVDGMAGRSLRDIRNPHHATDVSLSEDASFIVSVRLPDETSSPHHGIDDTTVINHLSSKLTSAAATTTTLRSYTYFGVADGVGSWREYGVDPREFSHKLMNECENILNEACHDRQQQQQQDHSNDSINGSPNNNNNHRIKHRLGKVDGSKFRQVISPAEIMAQAFERVKADNIVGSATACVALFDGVRHQLHFSNLGDSGLIVLRHIDSDVAGALRREKDKPRTERTSDLRLAFVSQQQLRSFNHPFQLGWTGQLIANGESTSFREARDACTSSIHVRRGDIVILATDGLFDNVDTDDICAICLDWEQQTGMIRGGDIVARDRRWSMGNSLTTVSADRINHLATTLVQRARENSLRKDVDSPFAMLAKENDVMWSGGMPDDCTCIAIHIVGVDADDVMDRMNQ